jgi:hypothetical protein
MDCCQAGKEEGEVQPVVRNRRRREREIPNLKFQISSKGK